MKIEELCEAWKNGGNARSYKCRFHSGAHYQDEVITDGSTVWYLHGHPIAKLTRNSNSNNVEVELSTLGYDTVTTISRLNFILHNCLGIRSLEFRLKYNKYIGYPVFSYVVVNGKTYRTNTIKIIMNGENVIVDEDKEIEFIMNNKKLEYLRKLYSVYSRKTAEIDEMLRQIENTSEYENLIADAKMLIDKNELEKFGLPYGLYKKYSYEHVKEHIKMLIEKADEVIENLKLALTTRELFP